MVVQLRKEGGQLLWEQRDFHLTAESPLVTLLHKFGLRSIEKNTQQTDVCVAPALEIPSGFEHLLCLSLMVLKATEEKVCYCFEMCRLHVEEVEGKDKFDPAKCFAFCVNKIRRNLLETASV